MCTIVVLQRVIERHPLIVLANRDEARDRSAVGPHLVKEGIVAGIDLESGGSWMGVNEHGLFAAITNQRMVSPPDRSLRSRGEVVLEVLEASSTAEAARQLSALEASRYNPFNLVFGQLDDVRVAYARRESGIELAPIVEPISVLANDRIGSPEFPKTSRALELTRAALAAPDVEAALLAVLADHHRPDLAPPSPVPFPEDILRELQALCIHLPFYGTVSATALLFDRSGHIDRYLYAAGPSCTASFVQVDVPFRGGVS